MSPDYLPFWAKLQADPPPYHPVLCHLLDVALVCQHLWRGILCEVVKQRLADALGLSTEEAGRWVAFWVGAHDIGKVSPAFQAKDPAFKERLRSLGYLFRPNHNPAPHGTAGTVILREVLRESSGWPAVDASLATRVAKVVGGHHGTFPRAEETEGVGGRDLGDARWSEARRSLLARLAGVFALEDCPAPALVDEDPAPFLILAGLCSVADWIGSSQECFPFEGNLHDFDDYRARAERRAEEALCRFGWHGRTRRVGEASFAGLFEFAPRPLQVEAEGCAGGVSGPGLALVEAPMGEGKTEAALLLADAWDRRLGQSGLYVALPTQATSNQMFRRVRDFLGQQYPDERVNLHLLHGHALLSDDYRKLRLAAVYDDNSAAEGRVVAEGWFAPKKRSLLAPFGVGTIDQVLLAVLQTRHGFVRLFGLANKTVILDEVHAYDVYMNTLLERLLAWLAALGCSVVLLSATLPRVRRRELLRAFAGRELPLEEVPYPRLVMVEGGRVDARSFSAAWESTVQLRRIPRHALAGRLEAALVPGGGCAAVICNTVREAQTTYQELRNALVPAGVEVELFHARFPFGRRAEIEQGVLARYGKEGPRPHAAVLVATQVVEQSLDLDFDLMVTEMAPVDLLLQRAGRLHRHPGRVRPPGLAGPSLWVLEPEERDPGGVPRFGNSEYVYERYVLLRSWLALEGREAVRLPDDLEPMVEAVYGDEPPSAPGPEWQAALDVALGELERRRGGDQRKARSVLVKPPDHPDDLFEDFCQQLDEDNPEVHPTLRAATRLGEPTVQVVCLHETAAGLRPAHAGSGVVGPDQEPDFPEVRRLLLASVALSHGGVVAHFRGQPVPTGWRKCSLLRYHRPAVFRGGELRAGRYSVKLDGELGIVIVRDEGGSDGP